MVIVMEDPLDTFHIALGLHRQKLTAKEKDKKTAMMLDGKYGIRQAGWGLYKYFKKNA